MIRRGACLDRPQLIPRTLAEKMSDYELLRALLPNLERSWMGTRTFEGATGTRTPVLRCLQTDTVSGMHFACTPPRACLGVPLL